MIDGLQQWATFDYPLHSAGNFDAITSMWVQVALVAGVGAGCRFGDCDSYSVVTFDDERLVPTSEYGFYSGAMGADNVAFPSPQEIAQPMTGYQLQSPITLGGRSDLNGQRHFYGRIAGLHVSSGAYALENVQCMVLTLETSHASSGWLKEDAS